MRKNVLLNTVHLFAKPYFLIVVPLALFLEIEDTTIAMLNQLFELSKILSIVANISLDGANDGLLVSTKYLQEQSPAVFQGGQTSLDLRVESRPH